jgi:hypothetical protein
MSVEAGLDHEEIALEDRKRLEVQTLDIHTATAFFERFEHLGNCGLGVWHYGVKAGTDLIGVISFGTTCFSRGRGAIASIADAFGLPVYQIARGGTANSAPFNFASRVLSEALRCFRRDHGECLLVAYADRTFNEIGTIYQACNALYTGKTDPKGQSNYIINGKWMNGWSVRKQFGTRAMATLRQIDQNAMRVPLTSKYRYLFALAGPTTKRRILAAAAAISSPYPKRSVEFIPSMNVKELILRRQSENTPLERQRPVLDGNKNTISRQLKDRAR